MYDPKKSVEWLRQASVEGIYGVPKSTMYHLIKTKDFPKPVKVGRTSLWMKAKIDVWMANQASASL